VDSHKKRIRAFGAKFEKFVDADPFWNGWAQSVGQLFGNVKVGRVDNSGVELDREEISCWWGTQKFLNIVFTSIDKGNF
jgi:hypothetical protein